MLKWKLPDFTRDDSYETQETLDPRSQDARGWRGHRGFLRSPSCHRSAEPGDLKTEKDHVIWCFEMLMFKRKWPDQYDEANDAAKRQKDFSWQQHQLGWEVFGQVAWAVIQLKDYTFLWNLLAPSDLHSIPDSPLFQASWENYHRRREEIIKDCNPPDRESRLRRIDVWGKSR